jgi:hypothetical protein
MAREVTVGLLVGLLELVKLAPLMRLTQGRPEIAIGLIDGPVNIGIPDSAPRAFARSQETAAVVYVTAAKPVRTER